MVWWQILLIVVFILAVVGVGLYFAGNKAKSKMDEQQTLINQYKQTVNMFIIDKKKDKVTSKYFPQNIVEQFPKWYRWKKFYLVRGKVETRIMTFICDEKIYNKIEKNKRIKVDISGLYIVGVKAAK